MNAQELRIGNHCLYRDKICKIDGISPHTIYLINEKDLIKTSVDCIKPIPLTEEILLKCGFDKCEGRHGIYYKSPFDKSVRLFYYDDGYCIGYVSDSLNNFIIVGKVIHLHKLQNFHFEFVGKELEINL